MKKIWLLIAAIAVISCKEEIQKDYSVLSGNISNKKAGEIKLSSNKDRTFKEVITIEEDGSFIDTLTVAEGTYGFFDGKNFVWLYLSPGSDIQVKYDAIDIKNSLTFTGIGSEVSGYIRDREAKSKEILGKGAAFYELDEVAYRAKNAEVKSSLSELIASFEGLPKDYKDLETRKISYDYLNSLSKYEAYHAYYAKKPDFKISEGFLRELDGVDYENEFDYENIASYKSLVSKHFKNKASELSKEASISEDIAILKVIGKVSNEKIKNSLLYDNAKNGVIHAEDLEEYYNTFMEASTNEEHNKEITARYTKLLTVAKGQPSPDFVNFENYTGGTTSLDDLKGKYVYVDVWATWCGPCHNEIPFLQEVEKKYHGKNIEFVSISVDKAADHDKWKAMVADKELGGIQLFADKGWKSEFVQGYLIKGIPRFILIDPEGTIISSNAPRPSNEKLIDLLNEYNI